MDKGLPVKALVAELVVAEEKAVDRERMEETQEGKIGVKQS